MRVASIGEYWSDWFEDYAYKHKPEIESLRADLLTQQAFVNQLKKWAEKQWLDYKQTAVWVLFALSCKQPFDQWAAMENCRKPDGLEGVFGLYLHRSEGGEEEDVGLTQCVLVPNPKPKSAQPVYHAHRLLLLDQQSRKTPQNALEALMNLLAGGAFWWHFSLWILFGEKPTRQRYPIRKQVRRISIWFGWLSCLTLLGFLTIANPWEYFENNTLIVPVALVFAFLSLSLTLTQFAPILREWCGINRQRRRWADHLRHGCVCITISKGEDLNLTGPSFGVALFFSILLALDRDLPAQSYLARRFMDQLKYFSSFSAFTGEIQSDGHIRPVARLKDKIEAAQACGFLKRLFVPEQSEIWSGGQTRQSDEAHLVGSSYAAGGIDIQPHSRVMPLIKAIGNFANRSRLRIGASLLINATRASLLVTAFVAIWHVWQLMVPLPDPILSGDLNTSAILSLKIRTDSPALFEASFTSDYWANQPAKQFHPDSKNASSGLSEFKLERQSRRKVNDLLNGSVEVRRLRRLLWIELPPTSPLAIIPLGRLLQKN